jgi:hypothetical protein
MNIFRFQLKLSSIILSTALILSSCVSSTSEQTDGQASDTSTSSRLPEVANVAFNHLEVQKYESIEIVVAVKAEYSNPYDRREVILESVFKAPDSSKMVVSGFWDGEDAWRIRFTPYQDGEWQYEIVIQDKNGSSPSVEGSFLVTPSDLHGWLQVGNWVNPKYSSHYFSYHDGTPFYGIGHCDALNILIDGYSAEEGVHIFNHMADAGENFVVWWPFYSHPLINTSYDKYNVSSLKLIDLVVQDAQKKELFLVFTIWDHPQLRNNDHTWGDGRWDGYNGFRNLSDIDAFFESPDVWVWQENLYHYIIARWGYSPAIGLWQTVSEINGTNAHDHTNPWHEKVNAFFAHNDPYRHPTTASMSGDVDWPDGHQAMDVPQVHVYEFGEGRVKGTIEAAQIIASWSKLMWEKDKPNWVGEFGVASNTHYPELFHNAIWGALSSGAAMTPAEWNSGGAWMRMTPEMYADNRRLGRFVEELPLAKWNPNPLRIESNHLLVRGWGIAGIEGGLFWVQETSMEGKSIEDIRAENTSLEDVLIYIDGLASGSYVITPYDTWQGVYLTPIEIQCHEDQPCPISLPVFEDDMAFKINRK